MEGELFDVTFEGKLLPGHELNEVKENLAQIFKVDKQRIEPYFSQKSVVVKQEVSREIAERYMTAFKRAGAQCILSKCHQASDPVTHDVTSSVTEHSHDTKAVSQKREQEAQQEMTNTSSVKNVSDSSTQDTPASEESFHQKNESRDRQDIDEELTSEDETNSDLNQIFSRLYSSNNGGDKGASVSESPEVFSKDHAQEGSEFESYNQIETEETIADNQADSGAGSIESDLFNDYLKENSKGQDDFLYDDDSNESTEPSLFSNSDAGDDVPYDGLFGNASEGGTKTAPQESLFSEHEAEEQNDDSSLDDLFADDDDNKMESSSEESLFSESDQEGDDISMDNMFADDGDSKMESASEESLFSESGQESDDASLDNLFDDDSGQEMSSIADGSLFSEDEKKNGDGDGDDDVTQPIGSMSNSLDVSGQSDKTQRMKIDITDDNDSSDLQYQEDNFDFIEESESSDFENTSASSKVNHFSESVSGKEKSIAFLLALLLGPLTWLYTFERDSLKFWINMAVGVTLGIACSALSNLIGGLWGTISFSVFSIWAIAAWIWPFIETMKRPDDFYTGLAEDGKLGLVSLISALLMIPVPIISSCNGIFFGFSHLARIKKSGGAISGQKAAMAGIIVGSVTLIVSLFGLTYLLFTVFTTR
jgi:hypothetical protein